MTQFIDELRVGFFTAEDGARVTIRLLAAMLAGAIAGFDRERIGKAAGIRTHMLVASGSALFILSTQLQGVSVDVSRAIQGVAAGIGFIGGGAILKSSEDREIHGLTTAAGIWMTAAIGVAAGLGHTLLAVIAGVIVLVILNLLPRATHAIGTGGSNQA